MAYDFTKEIEVSQTKETVEDIKSYPSANLPDRRIPKEALDRFGVKVALSQEDGKTIEAVYFPYKNQEGEITGYKKRDFTKPKDHKYHFTAIGTINGESQLFGYTKGLGGKRAWVAEGEFDVLATWWALRSCSNQDDFDPQVVGLPLGTGNATKCVGYKPNFDALDTYKEVVFCLDNDEATPEERKKKIKKGKEATEELTALFLHKSKVVDLKDLKDPNEYLLEKRKTDLYWQLMKPVDFKPDGFVEIRDVFEEATSIPKMGKEWPWPSLTKVTYGRRKGEGYYVGAGVKIGKSEFVNQLVDHIVKNESKPVSLFKLEEKPAMTYRKIAGKQRGKQFHKPDRVNLDGLDFKGDRIPDEELEHYFTKDELETAVLSLEGKVLTYDSYGATSWDKLKKAITYAVVVQGSEDVIIDPITRLTAGMDASETDTELRKFSDEISKLAKDLGFTYYCFCHLKAPSFGKPHSQGGQVVSEQFRGSRAMMESTYYMLGIERDKSPDLPEVVRNMSHVVLLEDRMFGNTVRFPVYYDTETGEYLEPDQKTLARYHAALGEEGEISEEELKEFDENVEYN